MYTPADKMYLVIMQATIFKLERAAYLRIFERVAPKWEALSGQEEEKLKLMNTVANYIMEKHPEIGIESKLQGIKE